MSVLNGNSFSAASVNPRMSSAPGTRAVRIGYLISRYPSISHTFILREVLSLKRYGVEVDVASINDPDRPSLQLTADENAETNRTFYVKSLGVGPAFLAQLTLLMTHPFKFVRALSFAMALGGWDIKKLLFCYLYFAEAILIAQWMRDRSLAHLHVHFATPAATVALILSRMADVQFSMTVHGPDEFYDVPGYYLPEKIANARFVCAIGNYARSQLMKVSSVENWSKIDVAPLGVNLDDFKPRPFRTSPNPFEVLCVGRLVPAKGQHILLSSLASLLADGRNVTLRFVGDGPDRASLEQEAKRLGCEQHVRFEGAVNQDRIRDFYRTADIFALASFAEGIPVVLMEAMAMEIPCVTTWITGIPELIRTGTDGLLVVPSDAREMAAAIARLIDDSSLRLRIGQAGRRRIQDCYDLDRNVAHLATIFRKRLDVVS